MNCGNSVSQSAAAAAAAVVVGAAACENIAAIVTIHFVCFSAIINTMSL